MDEDRSFWHGKKWSFEPSGGITKISDIFRWHLSVVMKHPAWIPGGTAAVARGYECVRHFSDPSARRTEWLLWRVRLFGHLLWMYFRQTCLDAVVYFLGGMVILYIVSTGICLPVGPLVRDQQTTKQLKGYSFTLIGLILNRDPSN